MTPVHHLATRYLQAFHSQRLTVDKGIIDVKATESLRKMKLYARSGGSIQDAIVQAGFYAKKQNRTMYAYLGNSYMHAVWRVTWKDSEYLDRTNNMGSVLFSVSPDLEVRKYQITR